MKTKLRILLFLTLFFCLTIFSVSIYADEAPNAPVITKDLPSTEYLKIEKRSIASDTETSALAAPARGYLTRSSNWEDPYLPGENDWSNPGNVGAPIGDVSLPVILSILFLYMIYRGVTTSRRRNNL
jgi:hypothetical protein